MQVKEHATAHAAIISPPGGSQEKALGVRVLKEVEELAVSTLEASQQSASTASCQAAKQFLHEEPYEQVVLCPWSSLSVQPFMSVQPLTSVSGAGMCFLIASVTVTGVYRGVSKYVAVPTSSDIRTTCIVGIGKICRNS